MLGHVQSPMYEPPSMGGGASINSGPGSNSGSGSKIA